MPCGRKTSGEAGMKPVKGVEGRGREEVKGIIAGGQIQRGEKVVKMM